MVDTATMFTVSWNWMNFLIESYMFLPQRTALTIELKLSSKRTIDDASRAISVPDLPIANPTSAFFKAGASFVPSPVTATTFPWLIRPVTRAYLSYGRDRARTSRCFNTLSKSSSFFITSLRTGPLLSAGSVGQSQVYTLQLEQTTPPIILLNYGP